MEQALGDEFESDIHAAYSKFLTIVLKLMTYKNYNNPDREIDENLLNEREKGIIKKTWSKAASLGVASVGKLLFNNIFSICPEALGAFSFGKLNNY